jgi:hypothetical protein
VRSFLFVLGLSLTLTGCIYSHTIEPLMTDYQSTPVGDGHSSGDVKTVTFYVSVEWDKNGIGAIAKKHGIEEIYYADIEETRVLSFWQQRKVHVYGR